MPKEIAVIGGGFYGILAAIEAAGSNGVSKVVIYEKESQLFSVAGKYNQARAHLGFHYPRSSTTIQQSKEGFEYYQSRFPEVLRPVAKNIYLIRDDGHVSSDYYLSVMRKYNLDFETIDISSSPFKYKDSGVPYTAIQVHEKYIDCVLLERILSNDLRKLGVEVLTDHKVLDINVVSGEVSTQKGERKSFDLVINCSYLNPFMGFSDPPLTLKYEYCMMLLIASEDIDDHALTIMDGEFISIYPWLPGIHSVSSVKYTPIFRSMNLGELNDKIHNITGSEIEKHAKLIERHMSKFVNFRYSRISYFLAPKMKIANDIGDERVVRTFAQGKCLSVLPGKLDAANIFLSELRIFIEAK